MLADTQRKLLDLKLFTNSHLFWGNTQLLKMPQVSKQVIPNWKGQYPIDLKAYLFHWVIDYLLSVIETHKTCLYLKLFLYVNSTTFDCNNLFVKLFINSD